MLTLDDDLPQAIPTTLKNANIPSFDLLTDVHPALQQWVVIKPGMEQNGTNQGAH